MEKTIQLIKDFFENEKWKYVYDDEKKEFRSGIRMNDVVGNLRIRIRIQTSFYNVYVLLNNYADAEHRESVSEYLHRANYGLRNGNFEFDYDDGEIRYKTYVSFENLELNSAIVEESILAPIFMFDAYGKNLFRLLLNESTPKDLVEEVEKEFFGTPSSDADSPAKS